MLVHLPIILTSQNWFISSQNATRIYCISSVIGNCYAGRFSNQFSDYDSVTVLLLSVCFFFFFGCTHSMWKFMGQGSNLSHSSDLSCCSDNTMLNPLYPVCDIVNLPLASRVLSTRPQSKNPSNLKKRKVYEQDTGEAHPMERKAG